MDFLLFIDAPFILLLVTFSYSSACDANPTAFNSFPKSPLVLCLARSNYFPLHLNNTKIVIDKGAQHPSIYNQPVSQCAIYSDNTSGDADGIGGEKKYAVL